MEKITEEPEKIWQVQIFIFLYNKRISDNYRAGKLFPFNDFSNIEF